MIEREILEREKKLKETEVNDNETGREIKTQTTTFNEGKASYASLVFKKNDIST